MIESVAGASYKFDGPMSVSKLHRLISQDICPNCHFFLEKIFLSSDPERVSFIIDIMPVKKNLLSIYYYFCHDDRNAMCPFLDLTQPCRHCNTPGKFLRGGFHFSSHTDDSECDCCSQCEFMDFFNEDRNLDNLIDFLAVLTIAQDKEIILDRSTFGEEFADMCKMWRSVMEQPYASE